MEILKAPTLQLKVLNNSKTNNRTHIMYIEVKTVINLTVKQYCTSHKYPPQQDSTKR